MPRPRKPIYLRLAVTKYNDKLQKMENVKMVKNYEGADVELTANPDDVKSGEVTESFTITVQTKDNDTNEVKVHYKNDDEPFTWTKVDNYADVIKRHGGELTDDAISFLGEVFAGEKNGAAIAELIAQDNSIARANAKNNQYQKVVNKFKPQSEEDKAKAFERMAEIFSKQAGVTLETAKNMLKQTMSQSAAA
jgi:hypothetical protein